MSARIFKAIDIRLTGERAPDGGLGYIALLDLGGDQPFFMLRRLYEPPATETDGWSEFARALIAMTSRHYPTRIQAHARVVEMDANSAGFDLFACVVDRGPGFEIYSDKWRLERTITERRPGIHGARESGFLNREIGVAFALQEAMT